MEDLGSIRQHLADFYSLTGRPSVDPYLLIRMFLVGYGFGIRSERRLCEELHLNLAYRWFCRVDPTDRVPNHWTFSKKPFGRFREIARLRNEIKAIRTSQFNVLLRPIEQAVEGLFEALGDGGDLARFLLLESYLDDSYYLYTSLFHSGRLSPNDNKFLIQIRAFHTPGRRSI